MAAEGEKIVQRVQASPQELTMAWTIVVQVKMYRNNYNLQ